jgi:threonine synthase
MRYLSTRGGEPCGFMQAAMRGRAPGGGFYLPQDWPQLTLDDIGAAARRPLADTVETLILRFAGLELDRELAGAAIREALTVFGHPAVAPLRELDPNLWLLDMVRGPTMTAADAEMQVLARLLDRTARARGDRHGGPTMLLATDGDDGPAAVEAFRDRTGVRLLVLFPSRGVSAAQRRGIVQSAVGNVWAVEVDGDASACRRLASEVLADEGLVDEVRLGSIGPENMVRVIVAAAVLLAASARLGAPHRTVTLGAPAGDSSVTFAAQALTAMGMGCGAIVLAEDAEGTLGAALHGGRYIGPDPAGGSSWPAGVERLYFEAAERRLLETSRAAQAFDATGAIDLPPKVRQRLNEQLRVAPVEPSEVRSAAMAARNVADEALDTASAAVVAAFRRFAADGQGPAIAPLLAHPAWSMERSEMDRAEPHTLPPPLRRPAADKGLHRLPADASALAADLRAFAGAGRAA